MQNIEVINDTINQFSRFILIMLAHQLPQKFGFYRFAKFFGGKHQAKIRHTITPNINFSYRPNTHEWLSYQRDSLGNTSILLFTNIYGTISF